jgi:predicted deacylase
MNALKSRVGCDIDLGDTGKKSGYLRVPNSINESAYGTVLIPIWLISGTPGQTILFTGGVHGDEYEGPIALMKIARRLDPAAISGRVIIIPCLNTPAVLSGTRLSPLDNLNLNRIFPGDRNGSVSMMIAHFVAELLLPIADFQVDPHSGGKTLEFLPTICIKESRDRERQKRTLAAAIAFGAPYVLLNRDLDETGLLESACEARGILHMSSELGGAGRVTPEYVGIAEFGIMNLLRHLGLLREPVIDPASGGHPKTRIVEVEDLGSYIMATDDGIFEPHFKIGAPIDAGQPLGQIHFPDNIERSPIQLHSVRSGVLISKRPFGHVRRGDNLAIVARDLQLTDEA